MLRGTPARAGRCNAAWETLGTLVATIVLAVLLAGCESGSSEPVGPTARVAGQMTPPHLGGDTRDREARARLAISDVWCRWNGNHVEVGATFQNGLPDRLETLVNPFYSLITPSPESFDGGVESGNVQSFTVGPRETLTWHAIVGRPDGPALPQQVRDFTGARGPIPPPLVGRPEITSCVPRLSQALPE